MKEQILKLRSEGHSYRAIEKLLGCSKGTISYHCSEGQKEKTHNRTKILRDKMPYLKRRIEIKISGFSNRVRGFSEYEKIPNGLTIKEAFEVLEKQDFKCYLTGETLDLTKSETFHFDHKVPISKGGNSTKDNLGICTRDANQAKNDLSIEDFINLCKQVIEYNTNGV